MPDELKAACWRQRITDSTSGKRQMCYNVAHCKYKYHRDGGASWELDICMSGAIKPAFRLHFYSIPA